MHLKLVYFIIGMEFAWIAYYLGVNIAVYVQTNSIADPTGRAIRQDVFGLGTHIGVLIANCAFVRTGNRWVFIVFIFESIRDGINLANVGWYSQLSSLHSLWVAVFVLAWYQVVSSFVSLLVFAAGTILYDRVGDEKKLSKGKLRHRV